MSPERWLDKHASWYSVTFHRGRDEPSRFMAHGQLPGCSKIQDIPAPTRPEAIRKLAEALGWKPAKSQCPLPAVGEWDWQDRRGPKDVEAEHDDYVLRVDERGWMVWLQDDEKRELHQLLGCMTEPWVPIDVARAHAERAARRHWLNTHPRKA